MVLNSPEEWASWITFQEEQRIQVYLLSPDLLIADYRREKQITRDYQGREILELLQNANDAAAERDIRGKVKIVLTSTGLVIANTGKPFSIGGVQSLRISDLSPKRNKKSLIGNKGLGFRAVLNWSLRPFILSGSLSLAYDIQYSRAIFESLKTKSSLLKNRIEDEQIRDDEVIIPALAFPSIINNYEMPDIFCICRELRDKYDTVIGMPFDSPNYYDLAKEELNLLKPEILLFTDNINELSINLPGQDEVTWEVLEEDGDVKGIAFPSKSKKDEQTTRKWHIYKHTDKVPPEYLDEHIDTPQDYELVIAIPDDVQSSAEPMPLFTFFPTEVLFPYPVLCHATLELETNRKHPQASDVNRFIIQEIATHLIKVAQFQSSEVDPWCRARLIARSRDIDPLLIRLGFRERLISEARKGNILPNLVHNYVKTENIKRITAKNLDWLPTDTFGDVLLPTDDLRLKMLINELAIAIFPTHEFRDRLNKLVFSDLESRAKVIAGLITNGIVPINPPPNLLIDEANKVITHSSRIYLPPVETTKVFDIPDWLNLRFVNKWLRTRLAEILKITDQRELRQKLSSFEVNEYALANIAAAMIAEARRRVTAEPDSAKKYIQDTLIALYLMYPENADVPKLAETVGMPLINKMGSISDARNLYFSKSYSSNGYLLESLYGDAAPEVLIATPEEFDLGLNGEDPVLNNFFKWLGIADLPREIIIDSAEREYFEYVLDSLPYPFKMEDYFTESKKDLKYASLSKIKSIDKFDCIFNSHPAAVLTWLAVDNRAPSWRYNHPENAELRDCRGQDRNIRRYWNGQFPSFIQWKIKNTEWLPVRDGKRAKPSRCMYGERALEKILPIPAQPKHELFDYYKVDSLKLRHAWDCAGVLPNISFMTPRQLVDVLVQLPQIDPEGKSARALYRNILENVEADKHDWNEPVKMFRASGSMWGKGQAGYKYYPVSELRHADTDEIPEQLVNKINVVDLPKRVGAQKVLNIFGIEPVDRRKINIDIRHHEPSLKAIDIQHMFQVCKPFLYALRQVKTRQHQEINSFKELHLILCRSIHVTLAYESINLELSLSEPYQWIMKGNRAYILEDPNEETSFRSDLFVDSVGSILAAIMRLENGGDFARILRCESNVDRVKLLKKIVGEISFSDIEQLKTEFSEAGRHPIIIVPEDKGKKAELIIKQAEIEVPDIREEAVERILTAGQATVEKIEHIVPQVKNRQIAIRKMTSTPKTLDFMRRITDGDICEDKICTFEKEESRWPIKVSHTQGYQGPRCDIISFKTEEDLNNYISSPDMKTHLIERFIEVKGRSSEKGSVIIKGNSLDAARVYAEQYYIYRIYEKNINENIILVLNDPLEHKEAYESIIEIDLLKAKKTEKYQLTISNDTEAPST